MSAEEHKKLSELQNGERAMVIALDRDEVEEDVVLRFLINEAGWDVHAHEVRLTKDLAEQLSQMLVDELRLPPIRSRYQKARATKALI